jgi:hypothetical protein
LTKNQKISHRFNKTTFQMPQAFPNWIRFQTCGDFSPLLATAGRVDTSTQANLLVRLVICPSKTSARSLEQLKITALLGDLFAWSNGHPSRTTLPLAAS